MAWLTWHEGLRVGLPEIDREHQALVAQINRVCDLAAAGHLAEVGPALTVLHNIATAHFEEEEALLARLHGPGGLTHRESIWPPTAPSWPTSSGCNGIIPCGGNPTCATMSTTIWAICSMFGI